MKFSLRMVYRWKVLTPEGLLVPPSDPGEGSTDLSVEYSTRESAIEAYAKEVNSGTPCPFEMILVEQHIKDFDWDV